MTRLEKELIYAHAAADAQSKEAEAGLAAGLVEEVRRVENAKPSAALEAAHAVLTMELERTNAQLEEERRVSEESINALRVAVESLRKELEAAQAELAAVKKATADVKRIAELEKSESELKLKDELQCLKAKHEEQRNAWQKELADAQAAVEAVAEARANGLKEELACKAARAVAETKVKELEELQEEMEEELTRVNTQLEEEHKAWEEGMDALRNTRWEADELQSDVTRLKMELALANAALENSLQFAVANAALENSQEETKAGLAVPRGEADGLWSDMAGLEIKSISSLWMLQ